MAIKFNCVSLTSVVLKWNCLKAVFFKRFGQMRIIVLGQHYVMGDEYCLNDD